MTRRSRIAVVVVVIAIAGAAWWGSGRVGRPSIAGAGSGAPSAKPVQRAAGPDVRDAVASARARSARLPFAARSDRDVTVTGRVIEIARQQPVGDVEVVFRGPSGELTTQTERDGGYAIRLAAGVYRAFVRDGDVLSIGRSDGVRLPGLPSAETANVPDEALMAIVVIDGDSDQVDGVDLGVVRGGVVAGRVVDGDGRPVAGAVLRARGNAIRPTLATDIAESDRTGSFGLRLPPGDYDLDASHPRFAGVESAARVTVQPGRRVQATVTLAAGCVISGRVIAHDGSPGSDGALEKQWGDGELRFAPAGRIEPDGTFRWVTTDEVDMTLRAWPWKSPPSPARRFSCRDGARFENVVFRLPEPEPDITGVLVDHAGEPVGFAFIDLAPLDAGGIAQQERTDATGRWEVYQMPAGRYRVTAQAEGRGVTTETIASPRQEVRLALGGTGRLEGTTSRLGSGSFELALATCGDASGAIPVPQSRRVVTVAGGRFSVEDLPACELSFSVSWHGRTTTERVAIPSGGAAHIELDLGPPRAKTVHGVVRDGSGKPVAGALVTATYQTTSEAAARTDASGRYKLDTFSSATLRAVAPGLIGFAQVGGANVDREQVDLVVGDASDVETED